MPKIFSKSTGAHNSHGCSSRTRIPPIKESQTRMHSRDQKQMMGTWLGSIANFGGGLNLPLSWIPRTVARKMIRLGRINPPSPDNGEP